MRTLMMVLMMACFGCCFEGCTPAQRNEIIKDSLDAAKTWVSEQLPAWQGQLKTYVDSKLREKELAEYASLDLQLAKFKTTDAEGNESVKTWKDFDGNKDERLDAAELAKLSTWAITEIAKRTASGQMTASEGASTTKAVGVSVATLAALMLLTKGASAAANKLKGAPAPASGPPPGNA